MTKGGKLIMMKCGRVELGKLGAPTKREKHGWRMKKEGRRQDGRSAGRKEERRRRTQEDDWYLGPKAVYLLE